MKHARLTVNLEAAQVDALNTLAQRTGLSASAIARYAIERLLNDGVILLPQVLTESQKLAAVP